MKNQELDSFIKADKIHFIWHKFYNYIIRTYGKDLHGEVQYMEFKDENGKKRRLKHRSFNDYKLSHRLVGHEVIKRIENYCKRYLPEIKIVRCDDSVYSGSVILLVPHPNHGITVMFLPQCTNIQNQFFLYGGHYKQLMKALSEMESIYDKEDLED
jgi:hypothetical protein